MSTDRPPVRVLVVDDQAPFRRAVSAILAEAEGFELIGALACGVEAERIVLEEHPDLALIDVRMPTISGPVLARRLQAHDPGLTVVLCSSYAVTDMAGELTAPDGVDWPFLAKEDVSPERLSVLWSALHPAASR